eukprot:COSAG02_NODE_42372_length_385_cov_0.720280_1_plen_84_part_10
MLRSNADQVILKTFTNTSTATRTYHNDYENKEQKKMHHLGATIIICRGVARTRRLSVPRPCNALVQNTCWHCHCTLISMASLAT